MQETDTGPAATPAQVAELARTMFADSLIGTETKSTFVAHISQMGLPLTQLTAAFWAEFRKYIRSEQTKQTATMPTGLAGSKPGLIPVHPCPRIYTCAFGNQLDRYKAVHQLTDEITAVLFPSDDEPILERILIRATANINNQVLDHHQFQSPHGHQTFCVLQ
jgi:hypothetical protein